MIYTLPSIWDAKKFATRYGLDSEKDFYVNGEGDLVVCPALPDDPPIFEPPDPFVPVPPGVKVHHWPEMVGWIGKHKVLATEPNGSGTHHECYYIIAEDEIALNTLMTMPNVNFEIGQPAYLKDK